MSRLRSTVLLGACLAMAGCITTPLEQREWFAVRTEHFDIWSSLGETGTRRLAVAVERFRAATEFLWGRPLPAAPVRTRLYAFDDRGVGRTYAFGKERSYLLERTDGDVIVLRTGEGWSGDARTPLRLAFARRLISSEASSELSPWLEEAIAQLASSVEIRGRGAVVGIPRTDLVRLLRDNQWISFDRFLGARDLLDWSNRERTFFEAESWALGHYLRLGEAGRASGAERIDRFREELEAGTGPLAAAQVLGEDLQRSVWRHVNAAELPSLSVEIRRSGASPRLRPVPRPELLEELGLLALAIDAPKPAGRYLDWAAELAPDSARVVAGRAALRARDGDVAGADAEYRRAIALAPRDAALLVTFADALRRQGADTADPRLRVDLATRARRHYACAIELAPRLPAAHAGLAATFLLEGEDPASGVEAVSRARELLPGDAAIRHLEARLALARGARELARAAAIRLVTRARSDDSLRAARALLEEARASEGAQASAGDSHARSAALPGCDLAAG